MRTLRLLAMLPAALLAVPLACARAPQPSPAARPSAAALRAEVTAMLDRGAAAWNRGDLDAFMSDYVPGLRTTYVTSAGIVHGPEEIRRRYAPRFAPGAKRDSLSFEGIEVDALAPGVAHAVAFYVLARGDSVVARGPTSLVLLRIDGHWRILHDHSS